MAELTTITGSVIEFEAAEVGALADTDADTGEAVTCVFGVEAGPLQTHEPVASLLARLRLKAAKLTRPDASPIWIVGSAVTSLRSPVPDDYPPGVQCVVVTSGLTLGVAETIEDVRRVLNAAGAHL